MWSFWPTKKHLTTFYCAYICRKGITHAVPSAMANWLVSHQIPPWKICPPPYDAVSSKITVANLGFFNSPLLNKQNTKHWQHTSHCTSPIFTYKLGLMRERIMCPNSDASIWFWSTIPKGCYSDGPVSNPNPNTTTNSLNPKPSGPSK